MCDQFFYKSITPKIKLVELEINNAFQDQQNFCQEETESDQQRTIVTIIVNKLFKISQPTYDFSTDFNKCSQTPLMIVIG